MCLNSYKIKSSALILSQNRPILPNFCRELISNLLSLISSSSPSDSIKIDS